MVKSLILLLPLEDGDGYHFVRVSAVPDEEDAGYVRGVLTPKFSLSRESGDFQEFDPGSSLPWLKYALNMLRPVQQWLGHPEEPKGWKLAEETLLADGLPVPGYPHEAIIFLHDGDTLVAPGCAAYRTGRGLNVMQYGSPTTLEEYRSQLAGAYEPQAA